MVPSLSRDEFLKPYLKRLPSMLAALKGADVQIGERTLSLNAWEHAVLTRALAAEPGVEPWENLLAEGVAFKIKLLQDLASSPVSPDDRALLPDDSPLWADSAEGALLLGDLKAALNDRIAVGDRNNYKSLNEFRNKLFNFLNEVRHLEDPKRAVAISDEPAPAGVPGTVFSARDGRQARLAAREAASSVVKRMAGDRPNVSNLKMRVVTQKELNLRMVRFAVLCALLVVAAIVAVVLLWPASSMERGKSLTLADFKNIRPVVAVEAAPPKVTITVERVEWEKMYPPLRQSILREIGKRVGAAGYDEAVIQTPDGVRQAGWTETGGIALR